jgi:hypothetical protein
LFFFFFTFTCIFFGVTENSIVCFFPLEDTIFFLVSQKTCVVVVIRSRFPPVMRRWRHFVENYLKNKKKTELEINWRNTKQE